MESRNKGTQFLRESVTWAVLSWGAAPTSPSQVSGDAEMVFSHLEMHNFIHSEPSFHCTEMDVAAHVILTSRLSHPYIKQPRELGVDSSVCHRRWIS